MALRIFALLAETNKAKNSALVLVYLPAKWDYYYEDGTTEVMRRWVRTEAEKRGILFVDLVEEFRRVPADEIDAMFIPGHWHYTNAGNMWVAQMLQKYLLSYPATERKLASVAWGNGPEAVTKTGGTLPQERRTKGAPEGSDR